MAKLKKAVVDASPLVFLAKLNQLSLLTHLYEEITIPETVYIETVEQGLFYGYPDAPLIAAFVRKLGKGSILKHSSWPEGLKEVNLGQGEKETIALAYELGAEAVIDESRARKIARKYGVRTRGTLGILVRAYKLNLIPRETLAELLNVIELREDIWIRSELCEEVRRKVLL